MWSLSPRGDFYGRPMEWGRPLYLLSPYFPRLISQRSQIECLPYFDTWCGPSANLECRYEMCCMRLAGNAGCKKSPKIRHLETIAQLCRAISSQLRQVLAIGKKLVNSSISLICPRNIMNYGPLAAEICWRVWGTPANWQRYCTAL